MDVEAVKEIAKSSNVIITWSLSVVGASLLSILGTDFIQPANKWTKLTYILFIPGWIYLVLAIRTGSIISRRAIVAIIDSERIPSIVDKMNDEFASQLKFFNIGLSFFSIWLLLFLLWWIFRDFAFNSNKP